MLVERASHPQFLSNTFLVADGEGGPAFFVDAGGPAGPLLQAAGRLALTPTPPPPTPPPGAGRGGLGGLGGGGAAPKWASAGGGGELLDGGAPDGAESP